jgi:hypothetical protein
MIKKVFDLYGAEDTRGIVKLMAASIYADSQASIPVKSGIFTVSRTQRTLFRAVNAKIM